MGRFDEYDEEGTLPELLTDLEKEVIEDLGHIWNKFLKLTENSATRKMDLRPIVDSVHLMQRAVMANAAARAYPEEYRSLGGAFEDERGEEHV